MTSNEYDTKYLFAILTEQRSLASADRAHYETYVIFHLNFKEMGCDNLP